MTATTDSERVESGHDPAPPMTPVTVTDPGVAGDPFALLCPYLRSVAGTWRSTHVSRDHACGAEDPPATLAAARQRELCLVAAHTTCATYRAARAADASRKVVVFPGDEGAALWPAVRSSPLVLDAEGRLPRIPASRARASGQVLLIALMVVAFAVLIVARTSTPIPPADAAGASASAVIVAPSASVVVTPAPTASPAPTPTATPAPTPAPSQNPSVAPTGRYRVKSGDTLSSIAARLGTTVRVLKRLNDISDPSLIRPGQVLVVP